MNKEYIQNQIRLINELLNETTSNSFKKTLEYLRASYEKELVELNKIETLQVEELIDDTIQCYIDTLDKVKNVKEYGIILRDNLKYTDYLKVKRILSELYKIEL